MDCLWRNLDPILMVGAMLSKSLIQFSVDGRGCVSSLLFDLKPNYGGGNEYNGCHTHHPQPCSRPLPTHTSTGDSWILSGKSGSVSCGGHCSFPLGPGAHKVLSVLSKSLFPQSCVRSGGSVLGLMVVSSKRSTVVPWSAAASLCARGKPLVLPALTGETRTLKGRSGSVSVESLGPGARKVLSEPCISDGCGVLIVNMILPLILSCWGFSFALGLGYLMSVGSNILLSMVVAVLEFSEEKMSICPLLCHLGAK